MSLLIYLYVKITFRFRILLFGSLFDNLVERVWMPNLKFKSWNDLSNYSDHNCLIGYILECEQALQLPMKEKTKKQEEEQQPLKSLCGRFKISKIKSCEESLSQILYFWPTEPI